MQELTLLLDIVGSAALVGGAALALGAQSRVRTAEAKRKALQARLEELEKRQSGSAVAAAAQQQQQTPKAPAERKADTRRVAELEAALARSEEERRAQESRFEMRLKELTAAAATPAVTATAAAAAPPPPKEAAGAAAHLPQPKSVHLSAGAAGVPRRTTRTAKEPVTLLLASGNESAAAELTEALKGAGYTVLAAATAADTLQAARDAKPTVIALDAQLGRGGDGFKALSSLKADAALRDIPVVLICPVKDRDRAVELGAAGCVAAPAAPNVLLGAVSAALVAHRKRVERSRLAKVAKGTGTGTE